MVFGVDTKLDLSFLHTICDPPKGNILGGGNGG